MREKLEILGIVEITNKVLKQLSKISDRNLIGKINNVGVDVDDINFNDKVKSVYVTSIKDDKQWSARKIKVIFTSIAVKGNSPIDLTISTEEFRKLRTFLKRNIQK